MKSVGGSNESRIFIYAINEMGRRAKYRSQRNIGKVTGRAVSISIESERRSNCKPDDRMPEIVNTVDGVSIR